MVRAVRSGSCWKQPHEMWCGDGVGGSVREALAAGARCALVKVLPGDLSMALLYGP